MELVVISDNYPSRRIPNKGAFVYNLVQELNNHHNITVIAPYKINELFRLRSKSYGKENCKVYRPIYMSFSNKKILGFNTGRWSMYFKSRATRRVLNNLAQKPDLIYAHFIGNALPGLSYVIDNSVPLVVASGESSYANLLKKPRSYLQKLRTYTSHFICVSEANKKGLTQLEFDQRKMTIIPNAVDYSLFKPMNKEECKEKLRISKHKFVVGFVGSFIHRKGPNRIIEAIKQLSDEDIQLICVGGKDGLTTNSFTKIIPPVPNYQLPEIYNAFDIFVLPTLSEGHCNAIEEAKACCIPIVSSLGTSVELQIDHSTGILINPLQIDEIAAAIQKLKDNSDLRRSMKESLKSKTGEQSLKNRALRISSLLSKIVKDSRNIDQQA